MSKATALIFTLAALLPPIDMWIIFVVLLIMTAVLWRRSTRTVAAGATTP